LAEAEWRRPPRLWLVTRGAQAVGSDPAPASVAEAALWGLGRVIANEHAEIWGGLVDLDPAAAHGEVTLLVEQTLRPGGAAQLASFLRAYGEEGWPPIRGVVHAAGIVQDQLLLTMDAASLDAVMRPKTLGAWALHRQLAGAPLDFFVLFSSVASMLGTIGQA